MTERRGQLCFKQGCLDRPAHDLQGRAAVKMARPDQPSASSGRSASGIA